MRLSSFCVIALLLAVTSVFAAGPTPEIQRDPVPAQATGRPHTLRQIPEACIRLEGRFTDDLAMPYRLDVVRTSPRCQPRARFVDVARAPLGNGGGWRLNDVIRVPSAACPSQQAVVRIWRKPVDVKPVLDAQGKARVYLEQARRQAGQGQPARLPEFAVAMTVEGGPCH